MSGPPPTQYPPTGQGSPPPGYAYNAPPAGSPPAGAPPQGWGGSAPPAAWHPGPMAAAPARPMNWDLMAFVFRFLGFLLLAVGGLVIVATVSTPSSLYNNPSASDVQNFLQGAANGEIWGKILFVLGALLMGLGAGIKLHWVLRAPAAGTSEQWAWVLMERAFNYAILAISIALIYLVLSHFPNVPTPA